MRALSERFYFYFLEIVIIQYNICLPTSLGKRSFTLQWSIYSCLPQEDLHRINPAGNGNRVNLRKCYATNQQREQIPSLSVLVKCAFKIFINKLLLLKSFNIIFIRNRKNCLKKSVFFFFLIQIFLNCILTKYFLFYS